MEFLKRFLQDAGRLAIYKIGDRFYALDRLNGESLSIIQANLYVKKAGVVLGKIAGNDFLPDHQFALSTILATNVESLELNKEEALQYLRKEEVKVLPQGRGWMTVTNQGFRLGWIKVLQNRVNNYYPKEWRILKSG